MAFDKSVETNGRRNDQKRKKENNEIYRFKGRINLPFWGKDRYNVIKEIKPISKNWNSTMKYKKGCVNTEISIRGILSYLWLTINGSVLCKDLYTDGQ